MPKQDKKVVKRGIITPDKHFPYADKKAIGCLLKSIAIIRPDFYVDLGDVGEFESVSHWQWRKKKRPPLEWQLPIVYEDIKKVNSCLDEIDEALDKVGNVTKYLTEGNHDDWLNRFVEENPYLKDLTFPKAMKLDERGYKYYPTGKYLKIGKLNYYHGHHYSGITHARNHLLKLGGNIMYGHFHDIQQHSLTHLDGAKSAWCIGCLKKMDGNSNQWLGNRQHNWSHAFAVVDYFNNGYFTVHVVQIINGKTSLWGELIEG
jgi:hypothetical protein